jgi:hypothetical protein
VESKKATAKKREKKKRGKVGAHEALYTTR